MKISVITVTYNSQEFIKGFLESVFKFLPEDGELIIVDSGSIDDTVKIINDSNHLSRKNFQLIESKENINFGRGNNLASQKASGDYLFILNPDTKLLEDPFTPLLRFLENHDDVGMVAPKLMEGENAQPSVRKLPTIGGAINEYWLGKKNSYEAFVPSGTEPVEVECVVGAALLISKKLFNDIGGFSKKYKMYFEDLQLCKDVRARGYKIFYLPNVKVFHSVGGSFNEQKQNWLVKSAIKYHGMLFYFILYFILRTRKLFGN